MKTNTLAMTLSSAIALSVSSAAVQAAENPFAFKTLEQGYQVADAEKTKEGKCSAGKCGANMKKAHEGSCSAQEGRCSDEKMKEGACHASK